MCMLYGSQLHKHERFRYRVGVPVLNSANRLRAVNNLQLFDSEFSRFRIETK